MSLSKTFQLNTYDCNCDQNIKISSLMKFFQQTAREDLDAMDITYNRMREHNIVFVLTKVNLKLLKKIPADNDIIVSTIPISESGVRFIRDFSVKISGEDEFCAVCSTEWVLIDFVSRKLLRSSALPWKIKMDPKIIDISPVKTNVLSESDYHASMNVTYSMIDENLHLNNTRYADIIFDHIDKNINFNCNIESFNIDFLHEAHLGDTLEINYKHDGNIISVLGKNLTCGNNCFSACIFAKEKN